MALVVIRIAQSHQTPHAISANTQVYVRTGNRNSPERLATLDEIEWVREQRRRSSDLRVSLYDMAQDRFARLYSQQRREITSGGQQVDEIMHGWLTLSICPLYPKDWLRLPPDLDQVRRRMVVREYLGTAPEFPIPSEVRSRIVQHGIVFARVYDSDDVYHTELNSFGLYFYRQAMLRSYESRARGKSIRVIRATEVFARLDEFLDSAAKFYSGIGYWGALQLRLDLNDIGASMLGPYTGTALDDEPLPTLESHIHWEHVVPYAGSLSGSKQELVLSAVQHVAWAFGWNVTDQLLSQFYDRV